MKIIIRADASITIGSGHIMRCLTIAHNFRERGHDVLFYARAVEGHMNDYIQQQGFEVISEWQPAHIIVVDHYQIQIEEERMIRTYTKKLVVIDDLARPHDCDVLLDQNIVENYESRYERLVPEYCRLLVGPQYLIMRDEFIQARQLMPQRSGVVKKILVFMGGADPTGETVKVLKALEDIHFEEIHVVCGNSNMQKETIQKMCEARHYTYHQQIDYMAKLMNEVDFAIGAGGATTWERCYVGLPSSSTIVADNQYETTVMTEKLGAVKNVGWHEQVTVETYHQLLIDIQKYPRKLRQISRVGLQLTESHGKPNPWIEEILEMNI